jgi:hypothetical protein
MTSHVTPADNLFDYFQDKVTCASTGFELDLSADTMLYIASMLAERARVDRSAPDEATLVELYARAAAASPAEKARTLRELGDRALYQVGYFQESLDNKIVGRSYYSEMGAAAYYRADQVFKRWFSDAFGPVFTELAYRFETCVGLLERVKNATRSDTDDLQQRYEQWLTTGSDDIANRLREHGILLNTGSLLVA